jgi:hypothetical protein
MRSRPVPRRRATWLAPLMLLSTTGCAGLLSGTAPSPAPRADCLAYQPIYLSEGAIAALAPFRDDRVQIATHNRTWEARCGGEAGLR